MANITLLPSAKVPLIYDGDNTMTTEWYRFFWNIYGFTGTGVVPVNKGGTGLDTIGDHQIIIGNANNVFEPALIRGFGINVTYDPGFVNLSLGASGVTPGTYGNAATVGQFTINEYGVITFADNVPIAIAASQIVSGELPILRGGTGASTAAGARANLSAAILGANNDITSMTAITGGISSPDFVQFDIAPTTIPTAEGALYWDSADSAKTLSLVMTGGNAIQQIGEEQYFRIKASSAITEGQVVMFTGAVGASGGLKGAPATGLTASTAQYVMGVATENIALNGWGYVTSFGTVRGINTTGGAEAWVDGEILYLNPAVAGGLTKTVPAAPNPKVVVAAVTHAASNGSLFIRPSFGGILGQYEGDVQVTTPANGDLLIRNQTAGKWVNAPLTAGSGVTISNAAGAVTISATGTGGTVTSVSGTGTVNGITLTGTVTSSGSLTLGGTLGGIGNSQLTNSTISGVALGGNLFNLTAGTGVSFSAGTTYNGSAAITINATGTGGTVTSVAALTLGTTGTDLSSTVANGTTTPVITLNVPTASATNRGALSAADWTTFNSKANAFTYTTNYIPYGQGTTTPTQSVGLQYNGTTFTTTGISTSNNLTFTGTGNRITGDFSNATPSNRALVQTSTVNSGTSLYFIPNGTSPTAGVTFSNSSAPDNSSLFILRINATDAGLISGPIGTGTTLPMAFYVAGANRLQIGTSGGVSIGNTTDPGATNLNVTGSATVQTLTIGQGAFASASNTALGNAALAANSSGTACTAVGRLALTANNSGVNNTATGQASLATNTSGGYNAAYGQLALNLNSTGSYNTAAGTAALQNNTASNNTGLGYQAGVNITSGSNNVCLGYQSGTDALVNITTASNIVVLGNNSTTTLYCKTSTITTSDIRDKTNIRSISLGLDFVNTIKPIAYQFKVSRNNETPSSRTYLGWSAQDVLANQGKENIVEDSDPEHLKMSGMDMVAILWKAVQELSIELEVLKQKSKDIK